MGPVPAAARRLPGGGRPAPSPTDSLHEADTTKNTVVAGGTGYGLAGVFLTRGHPVAPRGGRGDRRISRAAAAASGGGGAGPR